MKIEISWDREMVFRGSNGSGGQVVWDGKGEQGHSPMEGLMSALCGCMAIDVVEILRKMRTPASSLAVEAEAERNAEPPRYFTKIALNFKVAGEVPAQNIKRAIDLSFQTYCSVFHSLRKDIQVTYNVETADV